MVILSGGEAGARDLITVARADVAGGNAIDAGGVMIPYTALLA
jgi:hypothetical protein